jgi:iron complex transport system ATP-binding protein
VIAARNLTLAYGSHVVLENVSMRIEDGELLGIIGPNGAGKSTLLRALGGLHSPLRGDVSVDGEILSRMNAPMRARHVALVEVDTFPVPNVTVREAVAQGRISHRPWWRWTELPEDQLIVDGALERTQLLDRIDRSIEALSSGERQRVWVALALAQRAPNLLFDEPTSHLDLRNAMRVLSLLRDVADGGAAVAIVLHDLNLAAAHADRIALVGDGTLMACGAPERVFDAGILSRAYGTPICVRREGETLLAFAEPPGGRRKGTLHGQHLDAPR